MSSIPTFASLRCWKRESRKLKTYLKKMTENFPNWMKEIDTQVQETVSNKMNPKRPTP